MTGALGAVDGGGVAVHHHRAGAGEGVVLVHQPLLQGHGQDDGLEGGAGLVGLVDRLAVPLAHHRLVIGLALGLGQQLGVGEILRIAGLELLVDGLGLGLHVPLEDGVGDLGVVVGVEVGDTGDGQDLPGLGVHGDAEGPVLHVVVLDALLQCLLQIGLDGGVQGEGHVIAVLRVDVLGVGVVQLGAAPRLGGDHPAGGPLQNVVIGRLHPVGSPVGVDKAQGLGGQSGVGVVPLGAGEQVEIGGGLVLHDILPDGLGLLLLDVGLDLPVGVLDGVDLGVHPLLVQAGHQGHQVRLHLLLLLGHQGGPLRLGQGVALLVLLGHALHQVVGGQDQVVDGGRHGQHIAVAVIDVPPGGRHGQVQGLLVAGLLLILVVVDHGDVPQLPAQGEKHQHAAAHHEEHRPLEDAALGVGAAGGGGRDSAPGTSSPFLVSIQWVSLLRDQTEKSPSPAPLLPTTRSKRGTFCFASCFSLCWGPGPRLTTLWIWAGQRKYSRNPSSTRPAPARAPARPPERSSV